MDWYLLWIRAAVYSPFFTSSLSGEKSSLSHFVNTSWNCLLFDFSS